MKNNPFLKLFDSFSLLKKHLNGSQLKCMITAIGDLQGENAQLKARITALESLLQEQLK